MAPPIVGTGQTIAVVGETNLESADIQSFRDAFGITALGPNGSVQMENPPSSVCAAPDPSDNEPEGYLDAEWSGAMAPDATVDYVACGRQGVTSGADLAAAYIIGDPATCNGFRCSAPAMAIAKPNPRAKPTSFTSHCGSRQRWKGSRWWSRPGIPAVMDASMLAYATDGLSVVNEASTPYNIAAGGTDFSDVFSGTASTYWSAINGANF